MDKHFLNPKPRIAVNYWEGPFPYWLLDIINHNSKYFDTLYLIHDQRDSTKSVQLLKEMLRPNVELVITDRSDVYDRLKFVPLTEEEFFDLSPAAVSDLICYFPGEFLSRNIEDKDYSRIMYFDTNTIIWNRFLINEIFSSKYDALLSAKLLLSKESGYYSSNNYRDYVSTALSIENYNPVALNIQLLKRLESYLEISSHAHYTALGPSFLNKDPNYGVGWEVVPFEPNLIDPQMICEGTIEYQHLTRTVGLTISGTLVESAGYEINDVRLGDNKCLIKYRYYV